MGVTVAGEGWIDAFYDWFPRPQWVQVYDRRPDAPIPVAIPPSGGTLPLVPDPAGIQVPAVVPGPGPTFNNPIPPPLIPIGAGQLPPGRVDLEEDEKVALDDWVNAAGSIADIWRGTQQQTAILPLQFAGGGVGATPGSTLTQTQATALPKGMYMDRHGHLVHRRRRRRPCITQTDLNLANQVANLPNNANVRMFLAKCVK